MNRFIIILGVLLGFMMTASGAAQPSLIYPPDSAVNINRPIEFTWSLYPQAVSYELEIDHFPTFPSPAIDPATSSLTDTTLTLNYFAFDQFYFWRVRAYYFDGLEFVFSDWSDAWLFFTISEIPQLISPADNAVDLPPPPDLDWHYIGDIVSYNLQVDDNSDFIGPEIDITLDPDSSAYTATELIDGTQYFWRVRSFYYQGMIPTWSDWSPEWNFTLMKSSPDLASPSDGATGVCHPVRLAWDAIPNATLYHWLVSLSPDFTGYTQGGDAFTASAILNLIPLEENTQYWWKVRARIDGVDYAYSPSWTFTTNPFVPEMPALVNPADGATDQTQAVFLDWNAAGDAVNYRIQLDQNPVFLNPEQDFTLSDTYFYAGGLDDNTIYYWRVRAQDACSSWCNWTPPWHFTTADGSAVDDHPDAIRPLTFELAQNSPNPFNPSTLIKFTLPRNAHVIISVFDIIGQRIKILTDSDFQAGEHTVYWDGTDANRQLMPSGIYFYRIEAGDNSGARKMILLK